MEDTVSRAAPPQLPGTPDDPLDGAPDVTVLKRRYDSFRTATGASSLLQLRDRAYFDGPGQLNSDVRKVLSDRGQPAIYTNRIRPAIDGVLGLLDQAQTDPRAYPRNPGEQNENAADVGTKTLRFIAETNNFNETKLDCAEEHQIEGLCAAIIEIGGDGTDVMVTQICWTDFFYDPRSRRPDFKDALYMGAAKWMYAADVKALYPERYAAMGDPIAGVTTAVDSFKSDKPENTTSWVDIKLQRLMVVEMYYREGSDWFRCVFCAAGLFEFGPSPYQNDKQQSVCPIEATSCYVDRELNRYGRVRDMVPLQDETNARRSRLLHLGNSRQIQERETGAAVVSAEVARVEAAKADGVIPAGWMMVPTADLAAGQQLLLAESKSEIERMGPTPAVLGRQGTQGESGRARMVLQQAGMTEIARVLGRLETWEECCYKQMWFRARQYWTGPKFVRVTDDVRAPKFIQLNSPDGSQRIAEMDLDIVVDIVPDTANLAQEVWQDLIKLLEMYPPDDPRFQIAVEMSPIADKQRILERIKAFKDEQAQGSEGKAQQAQAMMQAQLDELNAKIADIHASALQKAAIADKATVDANVAQTAALAAYGPLAASFGIIPDQAGVDHAMARGGPGFAPQATPMQPPAAGPNPDAGQDAQQAQMQAPDVDPQGRQPMPPPQAMPPAQQPPA